MTEMNKVSYHTKLAGVSFEGRQDTISLLNNDSHLRFRREPDNKYDGNAVAVDALLVHSSIGHDDNTNVDLLTEWVPIGYIAKDKNSELAGILDDGVEASIKISDITGGGDKNYGVNVYIEHESKKKLIRSPDAKLVQDIFGNKIFYDDTLHQYTNALGEIYLSGSKYADQFEGEFAKDRISLAMAKKSIIVRKAKDLGIEIPEKHTANSVLKLINKVEKGYSPSNTHISGLAEDIQDMWDLNALASSSFGTAIHTALELYGRYKELSDYVGKSSNLHGNPVLRSAVQLFYKDHPGTTNVKYECLVVDHAKKRAGRIDRVEYDEDGEVWITDFKTNTDIDKSLSKYWLQLSFYAAILKANGLKVKGLKIYHYTGDKWDTIIGEVIDIDKEEA